MTVLPFHRRSDLDRLIDVVRAFDIPVEVLDRWEDFQWEVAGMLAGLEDKPNTGLRLAVREALFSSQVAAPVEGSCLARSAQGARSQPVSEPVAGASPRRADEFQPSPVPHSQRKAGA